MTHYNVSFATTVCKTMTKTQHIFFTIAGDIKHVDYISKKCAHFATDVRVCYGKPGYIIPVGHRLHTQFNGPFPFFVKVARSGL